MSLLIIMFVATFNYKKKTRKTIDKKKYKLWMFWGMAMFIVDRLHKIIFRKTRSLDKALKTLTVKEEISQEKYLYIVDKMSISVAVFFMTFFIATIVGFNEDKENYEIREINRSRSNYQLEVEYENGNRKEISIEVPVKELTGEEEQRVLEEAKQLLAKEILGKNESLDNVCYQLNLVNEIGEHNVSVIWDISHDYIVDYEGRLGKNIPQNGQEIQLEATLMLKNRTEHMLLNIKVFPSKDQVSAEEFLQQYVEEESINEEKVVLPEMIGQEEVSYYLMSENMAYIWVVLGIVVSIAMFFLKDKDLEKELKERNKQLVRDYPEIVSKILLFYGAGLSIKSVFEEMVGEYRKNSKKYRYVYEEMEVALNKMKTGVSEVVAINEFGNRCGVHCYIKMSNIIEQNIKRGTREITFALKNELSSAVNDKKNNALKRGSEISTKLLGPMLLMLVVAIAIVMVPAFMSMNI